MREGENRPSQCVLHPLPQFKGLRPETTQGKKALAEDYLSRGYKQHHVAEILGVSQAAVCRWITPSTWKDRNIERVRIQKQRARQRPHVKLKNKLRRRLKRFLSRSDDYYSDMVGCTVKQFRYHIESQFRSSMSWHNYGSIWCLDHIKPIAAFTTTEIEDGVPNYYTNLQPLFLEENQLKGTTYYE